MFIACFASTNSKSSLEWICQQEQSMFPKQAIRRFQEMYAVIVCLGIIDIFQEYKCTTWVRRSNMNINQFNSILYPYQQSTLRSTLSPSYDSFKMLCPVRRPKHKASSLPPFIRAFSLLAHYKISGWTLYFYVYWDEEMIFSHIVSWLICNFFILFHYIMKLQSYFWWIDPYLSHLSLICH